MNILILGIGNILFQDEGIGAHFVHYMDEKYEYISQKNSVTIVDGGTLAQRLIPLIVRYDYLIVVDCIEAYDSEPGDVYFFDFENAPDEINWQGSAHEVEMLQTLNMIRMNGDLPPSRVLGVIPKRIDDDTAFELSEEIIAAADTMEQTVIKHLESLDVSLRERNPQITISAMAQISFKREIVNDSGI
ncbi:HyaD/HybD family hydrogenase maturation endopeptidase [bacterium]|nr:HyaD/HybD family hydrogenase maturation endopeptidase [bacterium]MBU1989427.1 HyaD/HybD family hydrogenase maturation endopeptidase [bacterium]